MSEVAPVAQGIGSDGRRHALLTDAGPLGTPQALIVSATSTPAPALLDYPGGGASSRVVTAAPTHPLAFRGRNLSGVTRFFMVFDASALPANGTASDMHPMQIPGDTEFGDGWPPVLFSSGFVWAVSTTDITLTLAAAMFVVDVYHRP